MSFKAQLLELEKQTAQVQALEAKFMAERQASLAALPYQFGYRDLPSFIKAVKSACRGNRPKTPRAKKQSRRQPTAPLPIGEGMARSLPSKPPEPTLPVGTSLDDPANFGLLPDKRLLDLDLTKEPAAKEGLSQALALAGRVLHTSKVPATVWREWRQFERQATELLRIANSASSHVS